MLDFLYTVRHFFGFQPDVDYNMKESSDPDVAEFITAGVCVCMCVCVCVCVCVCACVCCVHTCVCIVCVCDVFVHVRLFVCTLVCLTVLLTCWLVCPQLESWVEESEESCNGAPLLLMLTTSAIRAVELRRCSLVPLCVG